MNNTVELLPAGQPRQPCSKGSLCLLPRFHKYLPQTNNHRAALGSWLSSAGFEFTYKIETETKTRINKKKSSKINTRASTYEEVGKSYTQNIPEKEKTKHR